MDPKYTEDFAHILVYSGPYIKEFPKGASLLSKSILDSDVVSSLLMFPALQIPLSVAL